MLAVKLRFPIFRIGTNKVSGLLSVSGYFPGTTTPWSAVTHAATVKLLPLGQSGTGILVVPILAPPANAHLYLRAPSTSLRTSFRNLQAFLRGMTRRSRLSTIGIIRMRAATNVKTIFHVDMDAFFVSVEELLDPSLKGKPVIVGGQKGQRGVVSAASYAARKFGVHSAMPLRTAAKLCPDGIYLDGHPHLYREYSHKVHQVLQEFSPQVAMASVDEAYLDLTNTERLLGPPLAAAHALHERVKQATGLNCSIGIATSKMVAKVASDQAKPNGILFVQPTLESAFLAPLDVRKIPGVGKVTEAKLHEFGLRKVGDLGRLDAAFLERHFGAWGLALAGKAQGLDAGAWFVGDVGDGDDPKSISHEHTFNQDTADPAIIEATLAHMAEKVARRLREQRFYARTVHLKLRYSDFSTFTRARTLSTATQLDQDIIAAARDMFRKAWKSGGRIRLIGVGLTGFDETAGQLPLDHERQDRARRALAAADRLRDKFGESSVKLATGMTGGYEERVHENPVGLPGKLPKKDTA